MYFENYGTYWVCKVKYSTRFLTLSKCCRVFLPAVFSAQRYLQRLTLTTIYDYHNNLPNGSAFCLETQPTNTNEHYHCNILITSHPRCCDFDNFWHQPISSDAYKVCVRTQRRLFHCCNSSVTDGKPTQTAANATKWSPFYAA